jgi:hypothetical protein
MFVCVGLINLMERNRTLHTLFKKRRSLYLFVEMDLKSVLTEKNSR